MPTVMLVGALDTKGVEYGFLRDCLHAAGVDTLVVDTGVLGDPRIPADITAEDVAAAAGSTVGDLRADADRGRAMAVMSLGAASITASLFSDDRIHGAIGLGGTGGSAVISAALRTLPVGVPKVLVSTVAAGDTSPYVGESDIAMFPSIVDIAGLNSVSTRILANAAGAIAGMVTAPSPQSDAHGRTVAATMFGVTTPAVDAARERLEDLGYEVLVFHATGAGGRAMESLVASGMIDGVLDLTTTELADELVGGVFSAGPRRLTVAAEFGIPQVVSVGAVDMVNFGAPDTLPREFRDRVFHVHNANVTLMRTTADECHIIGQRIAERLSAAVAPTTVTLPLQGVSAISGAGGPFADTAADHALFDAIRQNLPAHVRLREHNLEINDPEFARDAANTLHEHILAADAARTHPA